MPSNPRDEVETQIARWRRFEDLVVRAERSVAALTPAELRELASTFRLVTLDLAIHQRRETPGPVRVYLNSLVSRARRVIYQRPPQKLQVSGLIRLLTTDFPRAVRAEMSLILLATALTFVPAVLGYWAMETDPVWMRSAFPMLFDMMESQDYGSMAQPEQLAAAIRPGSNASASAFITTNNIRVSLAVYGFGLTFGLGTLYYLAMNGAMLGAVAYFYLSRDAGFQEYFYAGILPHGVLEMSAIILAGAAGLVLGRALVFPGDLARTEALRLAAPRTIPLVGGVIMMLLVAGSLEGWVTPAQNIDPIVKMLIGIGIGVAFWSYVSLAGREAKPVETTSH
ncbi:MAG: stage II sporulation protein M [bacterium]